jgi:hypothetical protein
VPDVTIKNHAFLPHRKTISNPAGYLLGGYTHRMPITIDSVNFLVDRTNYVILVDITDAGLRTIANGGNVVNSDGSDIAFTDSNQIDHIPCKVQVYDPVTGHLMVWVKIPVISSVADTLIYLYCGRTQSDPAQPEPSATWAIDEDIVTLGEVDGSYVHDLTPANNDGVIILGAVTEEAGLNGLPCGKITIATKINFPQVRMEDSFSITGWIKHAANPGSGFSALISSIDLTSPQKFQVLISQDSFGPLTLRVVNGALVTDTLVPALGDLGWHHIGIVLAADGLKVYFDSVLATTDLANINSGLNTETPMTFANAAAGGYEWLGRFSLFRFANSKKELADIALERLVFLNPSSMVAAGALVTIPAVVPVVVENYEVPITIVGQIDLNHVYSDYNVFYQLASQPVVHWISGPFGMPEYMTLSEWQKLGQDLHSRLADPTNPDVYANVTKYTDLNSYAINNVIGGPCCARFLFCLEPLGMETCDPSLPVFIQHVHSQAGEDGWSNLMVYNEAGAKFQLRTWCGPCDKNGLLKDNPLSYP